MPRRRRIIIASLVLAGLVVAAYLWLPWPSDPVITAMLLTVVAAVVVLELLLES